MFDRRRGLLCILVLSTVAGGVVVACSDGSGGAPSGNGGAAGSGGSAGASGSTNAGGGGGGAKSVAGSGGIAGGAAGESGGDAAGAAGATGVPCHISWSGAETGEVDCGHDGVCHHNFLSVGAYDDATPAPIGNVQLIYSTDADLVIGTVQATGPEIVNTTIQTSNPAVHYEPIFDSTTHLLTAGTSMTLKITSLEFSQDPNDVCSGVAHGSLDAVLRQSNASAPALTVHADF